MGTVKIVLACVGLLGLVVGFFTIRIKLIVANHKKEMEEKIKELAAVADATNEYVNKTNQYLNLISQIEKEKKSYEEVSKIDDPVERSRAMLDKLRELAENARSGNNSGSAT